MLQHYNQEIVYEVFNLTNAYTISIFLCAHLQFEYVKWRNTVYVIRAQFLLEKYDKRPVTLTSWLEIKTSKIHSGHSAIEVIVVLLSRWLQAKNRRSWNDIEIFWHHKKLNKI